MGAMAASYTHSYATVISGLSKSWSCATWLVEGSNSLEGGRQEEDALDRNTGASSETYPVLLSCDLILLLKASAGEGEGESRSLGQ